MEGSQLRRLDNVSALRKLRRLNAHMNRLSDVTLAGLDSLESVDLSHNLLEVLAVGWIDGGTEDIQVKCFYIGCLLRLGMLKVTKVGGISEV